MTVSAIAGFLFANAGFPSGSLSSTSLRAVDPSRRRRRTFRKPDDRVFLIFAEMVESMKALCKLDSGELSVRATTHAVLHSA